MILTHESTNDQGDITRVYRDKTSRPRIAVIHDCAHRGGCLYLGPVTVLNQDTGKSFTFSSTSAPLTPEAAAGYAERHLNKVI